MSGGIEVVGSGVTREIVGGGAVLLSPKKMIYGSLNFVFSSNLVFHSFVKRERQQYTYSFGSLKINKQKRKEENENDQTTTVISTLFACFYVE